MRKIKVDIFKQTGKFYTDKIIEVPESLQVFEISEGIKNGTIPVGYESMPYVMIHGVDPDDDIMYPCLIIRGQPTCNNCEPKNTEEIQDNKNEVSITERIAVARTLKFLNLVQNKDMNLYHFLSTEEQVELNSLINFYRKGIHG